MQLVRYARDPVAWAERTYAAAADDNGHGIAPDRTWRQQVSELR